MTFRSSRRDFLAASLAGMAASQTSLAAASGRLQVLGLRCNTVENPIGVQFPDMRLSWRLESATRGTMQTAYQVQVASSIARLKTGQFDLWDSGKVASDRIFDIAYMGKQLASRERACWQVRVWDNHGQVATSATAFWEMGLLSSTDWTGLWLAAEDEGMRGDRKAGLYVLGASRPAKGQTRQVRLTFTLDTDADVTLMTQANTAYVPHIDGRAIALPPYSPVAFGKQGTVESQVSLKAGRHVLALTLDDLKGWGLTPESLVQCALLVRATLTDGRVLRFNDRTARTSIDKPDAWMSADFDDAAWPVMAPVPGKTMPLPGRGAFLLRRDFTAAAPIVSARLYVTALGGYETHINGVRVGDDQLAPESTDFSQRLLYRVHDVTALLKAGNNAIGAMVGDGWYGSYMAPAGRFSFGDAPLRYIAQLEMTYVDGRSETITTDEKWSIAPSPITMSEIYDGENYDARLEQPGWATAGFVGKGWSPATIAPSAKGRLEGMISPPIRRTQTLKPESIKTVNDGYVIDFGQNFAGWVRLKAKGKAGDRITLKFAEILKADGSIDQSNLRAARATDNYILKGDPEGETYEPHFTYHGFRYVEVSGLKATPLLNDVTGIVVHSDLEESGHLRIGSPLIQKLWQNTLWSQRSNFMGIPTDCPQRDERLGWMGDANVFWDAAAFNMNVAAFTERWMGDIRDAQSKKGAYSNVSPNVFGFVSGAAPGWADAGIMLPWTVWKRFGDTAVIDRHWQSMTRYIDFIGESSEDYIWTKNRGSDFGDWLSLDSKFPGDATTPKDLVATAMWKHSVDAMIDMARATGRTEAVAQYAMLSASIKAAFIKAYVQPDGTVSNDSQTSYILALHYDLLPEDLRAPAAAKLKTNIIKRGNLLTTGFLGTPFSLDALADAGESQLVYDLLLRTAYPSWGYMVVKGATTIWERWNGDTGDVSMNSYNHYSLGAETGFIFRRIAGIDPVEAGFKTFRVDPVLDPRVKTGGAEYDAMPGRITTDWRMNRDGSFELQVSVPANTRAQVHLPTTTINGVREGGREARTVTAVRLVGKERDRVVVEVGSGNYSFSIGKKDAYNLRL